MALISNKVWGVEDKVQIAIDRLREFEPTEGYYLAFSGGKDSQTVYELAKMAGVKYDAHYALTTVDPPELVMFIKTNYPDVQIHRPELTMWQLIPKKLMPPTRLVRYCCSELKEQGGAGRVVLTGVRWAESARRKNSRRMVENCFRDKSKTYVNAIIDWSDDDVWGFIKGQNLDYCELYDQGFARLGCIGCPLSSNMKSELDRWPKYKQAYIRTFDRMIQERIRRGKTVRWQNGVEVMEWWLNNQPKGDPDQTILFE